MIKENQADLAIVIGSDSFSMATFSGFNALQALSENGCSPFSETYGISLGEGAGVFMIESLSHAQKRKAPIYTEVMGYGFNSDAYHATSPDITGEGARRTMNQAILMGNVDKNQIQVICAHGTGTEANDKSESLAIKSCFDDHSNNLVVTSTKSLYGHTLGAAGITQSIIMIDCMQKEMVPPILNFKNERPGCDLNYAKNTPVKKYFDTFLSNSFAFGGNNVSVLYSDQLKDRSKALVNSSQKIVISGYGMVAPHFSNSEEMINLLSATNKISTNQTKTFEKFILKNKKLRKYGKAPLISKIAIQSVEQTLDFVDFNQEDIKNLGILFGVAKGPIKTFENFYQDILDKGAEFGSALDFQHIVMNSIAGQIAIAFGMKGCNTTVSSQFSPFICLKYAYELLKNNIQDAILVGGSDELSSLDRELLPQSKHYANTSLSEGAASLLIETEDSARKNNRSMLGEIDYFSSTSFSPGEIDFESYRACLNATLEKGRLTEHDLDLHIQCIFGSPDTKVFNVPTLDTQFHLGIMESTTALLNIIYGIMILSDKYEVPGLHDKIKRGPDTILISGLGLNGCCNSFILKRIS